MDCEPPVRHPHIGSPVRRCSRCSQALRARRTTVTAPTPAARTPVFFAVFAIETRAETPPGTFVEFAPRRVVVNLRQAPDESIRKRENPGDSGDQRCHGVVRVGDPLPSAPHERGHAFMGSRPVRAYRACARGAFLRSMRLARSARDAFCVCRQVSHRTPVETPCIPFPARGIRLGDSSDRVADPPARRGYRLQLRAL